VTNVEAPTAERIRNAALVLFSAKGFAATGIRELAEAAGLSSASLYHHMGTKDDLLIEIMKEGHARLTDTAQNALSDADRPEARLARLVQVHVVMHAVYNLECRVIDTEVRSLDTIARKDVVAMRDSYEALWSETLAAGLHEETFQIADVRLATLALIDLCTGVAAWFRTGGDLDAFTVAAHHVDLALSMVSARRNRRAIHAKDMPLLPPEWFTGRWSDATDPAPPAAP